MLLACFAMAQNVAQRKKNKNYSERDFIVSDKLQAAATCVCFSHSSVFIPPSSTSSASETSHQRIRRASEDLMVMSRRCRRHECDAEVAACKQS